MTAQWRVWEDAGRGSAGAGAGNGWAPAPPPGGGSYGGTEYPINAEEAAFARDVRMLELKARKQVAEDVLARRAPAFGVGGGDSKGVTAIGATTASAAIGRCPESARAGKSGASPGAGATIVPTTRGQYKKKVRP